MATVGNPVPTVITVKDPPTNRSSEAPPNALDTYNSHPATALTTDVLVGILREAERGMPCRQCDLFDDTLETDGHLRGLHEGRIEEGAGKEWVLNSGRPGHGPSDQAARDLEDRLNDMANINPGKDFREFLKHQYTAAGFGYACTNIEWNLDRGLISPTAFNNVPQRRFRAPTAERANEIWLVTDARSFAIAPLDPASWAITRYGRNPYAAGYLRTSVWWSLFKRTAIRDWQVFAAMFGLPYIIGLYEDGATPAQRAALVAACESLGEDGFAVLSALCSVHIENGRAGDSSTVYPVIAKNADEENSKLITGGTLNTDVDGKGSYALGDIHESRAHAKIKAQTMDVQQTFHRSISRPFTIWNGYADAAAPQLHIQISRDSAARAAVVAIIGQAIDLDPDQLYQEFCFRKPQPGKGIRMPVQKVSTPKTPTGGN